MRYFLKIKQNGKQIGSRRIQSKQQLATTDELLALISKFLNIDKSGFIVRVINDQHNRLKVINGWKIEHYRLRSGLQYDVQILPTARQRVEENHGRKQEIGLLFNNEKMGKIIQEQQEQGKSSEIESLVMEKYEEILKLIQNNDAQAYFKLMKANIPSLGPCQNEFYKKQLKLIQNQLGVKGWAAIHYAVFAENEDILNYLIEIGVDVNIKSFDEWLSIQLAVEKKNMRIIEILVAQPNLNINICTSHGLVLNMAAQLHNIPIIQKLLMKDVDFQARDHLSRTVYDVLGPKPDKQILQILKRGQRRQSLSGIAAQKNTMYHALIAEYRGEVVCIKTPPRKNKDYYLCINPYEKSVKIYEEKIHYPSHPKEVIPMSMVKKFKQLEKSQKSWYMKDDLSYFNVLSTKNKYIFGCHFEQTVKKWLKAYEECQQHVRSYPDSISKFQRNDKTIIDRIQLEDNKRKASTNGRNELINLFTSKYSQRTNQSPVKSSSLQGKLLKTQVSQSTQESLQKNNEKKTQSQKQIPKQIKSHEIKNNFNETESPKKYSLKFSDFKILKTLGEGAFGTVYLAVDARNPERKRHYALKSFKKKKLVINKQIKYTVCELNILKQLSHPYIVNLHFTFQTPNYVYLGLDYCPNRDLSHHLMNEVTFPEKQAMIYTAEILLALQYLHGKNIIYRDLKPQNIMLDEEGHIKLVDFGLSKQGNDQDFVAKSFCGSPAYLSPEMLVKKGVGKESDFYCLGAVLYEMIVGEPPYFSDDVSTLYNNISHSKLTFPKTVSQDARTLLIGLLQRNPQKRLGYKNIWDIKNHNFFKDINWNALQKRQIKAPVRQQLQMQEQDQIHAIQLVHQDYDYNSENYRVNRFLNFSFIRQEQENNNA